MPENTKLYESIRIKQGLTVATAISPHQVLPTYMLYARLRRRLLVLTTIFIEGEDEREEMIYRILTRCEKAQRDKELFLVFVETHPNLDQLFNQTPASVFFEYQRWKKYHDPDPVPQEHS